VQNLGTGICDPESWYDGVYLSLDQILDETDYSLGARYHQTGLAIDGLYSDSLTVTIPSGLSGRYYFFVKTDKNNNVYEHAHEDDNTAYEIGGAVISLPAANVDLIVSDISVPTGGVSGDSIQISWTVTNTSTSSITGIWKDAVYISADSTWDLNDGYLGSVVTSGGLGAGMHQVRTLSIALTDYFSSLEASVPGLVPGAYSVLVRTDVRNNINESNETNNLSVSDSTMSIGLTELTLNVPHAANMNYGQRQYYHLGAASHDLRFIIDCSSPYDELELYVQYGTVPDRIRYDFVAKADTHAEIIVPRSGAGDCYIMMFGDYVLGTDHYTIKAEPYLFGLSEIMPTTADNSGFVRFTLTGGQLESAASVRLKQDLTVAREAWEINVVNSTKLEADFDLRGLEAGTYDMVVITSDPDTTELTSAVELTAGQGPKIIPAINGPNAIRKGVMIDYTVVLDNSGAADAYDVLSGLSLDAGTRYQIIMDNGAGEIRQSDGSPILLYTNFVGAGSQATFTVRVSSLVSLSVDVLSVHSDLSYLQVGSQGFVISSWVDSVMAAFADRCELDGITIDRVAFREKFASEWTKGTTVLPEALEVLSGNMQIEQTNATALGQTTNLVRSKIERTTLNALRELNDPEVPSDLSGITVLGLSAEDAEAEVQYSTASQSGRFMHTKKAVTIRIARDPNEKVGPTAADQENFVSQLVDWPYTIYFENVPTASAAARQVVITDSLDANLDWRKFRLGEIAFGNTVIKVPANRSYYNTTLTLASGNLLEIDAGINALSGEARWTFTTIDPITGQPPLDPHTGFLPPNDTTGTGQGHVYYTVKPNANAAQGAEIRNKALIVFDTNDPIETNEVVNVIQKILPDLQITASSGGSSYPSFVEGEPIALRATIANMSDAPTKNFSVAFYDGDPDSGGTLIGSPKALGGLNGNSETIVQTNWTCARQLGQRYINIRADLGNTVEEIDETNNARVLTLDVKLKTYTVNLSEDVNIVSLPLEPAEPFTAHSFVEFLGATQVIRCDTAGHFETFVPGMTGNDFAIERGRGYLVVMPQARQVIFYGITHLKDVAIVKGMNMISLPLMASQTCKARTLCSKLDARMIIRYASASHAFEAFIPDFHSGEGFDILGGKGYVAAVNHGATISFDGKGWIGTQPLGQGLYETASDNYTIDECRVLGLTGTIRTKQWEHDAALPANYSAIVTNSRTGMQAPVKIVSATGEFSGAFIDITNGAPIHAGDKLELIVLDERGKQAGDPIAYTVAQKDIKRRYIDLDVTVDGIAPSVSNLYQNFPNPFNPMTRIRYQIARAGTVKLRVYNVAGQLVKTLIDESKKPGYYEAVWKGDNNRGASVASGVYFYRLEAPQYSFSRKLVILR
jgi:hypothetical protein